MKDKEGFKFKLLCGRDKTETPEQEDELSRSLASCRVKGVVVPTWINFLEDTWTLQRAYTVHNENQINYVMVGNGKKIPISHYGNSLLSFSSSPLKLNNILHAPALSNKIISVSKLCADNTTFVEFYHDFFLVKDQVSKKVLLQGQLVNGLYQVSEASKPPISSLSKVFLFSTQETNLWHHRLGHFSRCVPTQLARLAFD
ncbi:hypothetical protein VitviT2T_030658 [Vitis vinifera]|nr:hypothetical protein VitviT2T_030658 [Vitis vinifera]